MLFQVEIISMAPEIFLVCIIHCLLVYGVITTTSAYLNYPILLNNLNWLSIQCLFFVALLIFFNPLSYTLNFNKLVIIDQFGSAIKLVIILMTICTILISIKSNLLEKINAFESAILILLAVTGILLLVSSFNFIAMYLAIELQSFCLYILAALNRTSEFSTEAGLKYFVLGAFSSGLLLFGLTLVYGFTGIMDLGDLFQFLSVTPYNLYIIKGINLASIFILIGLFFKLSVVPFHIWAPDIYEGSPTMVTAFFAIVPKIGILALLTRLTYLGFYDIFFSWQELFVISSICSIIVGTFGALTQIKLKRMLAYSAIGHLGYVLIGFSAGCFEGVNAGFIYIVLYMIMAIISFIILLGVYKKKGLIKINYIKDLSILTNANPLIALVIALTFFSMAGIPPISGFFSKMFLFIVAIQSKMYALAIIAVITSVISCFYYLRIIKLVFFNNSYLWVNTIRLDRQKSILLGVFSFFLIFIAIYPIPILYGLQNVLYFVIRNQFNFI